MSHRNLPGASQAFPTFDELLPDCQVAVVDPVENRQVRPLLGTQLSGKLAKHPPLEARRGPRGEGGPMGSNLTCPPAF